MDSVVTNTNSEHKSTQNESTLCKRYLEFADQNMTGVYNRDIAGSWFSTGFHGHFRSKTRLEYTVPYRQRAKPPPPQKFLDKTKERSNRHLFSIHDNRHIHSDMGNLETYFGLGLGKRKYFSPNSAVTTQHTKSTHGLTTWRGNENDRIVSTYRSHFDNNSLAPTRINESEPVHVRANTTLRRRHFRACSAPPTSQHRTAPLLAWNEPDEHFHSKPGVGLRQQNSLHRSTSVHNSPFAHTAPAAPQGSSQNYTVSETVTPLNCTAETK